MTCEGLKDRLDDYVDGELTEAEFQELELHLSGCGACREEERSLRAVLALAAALPPQRLPARDLWPSIAEGIQRRGRLALVPPALRRPSLWWAAGLAAAAAVVLAVWVVPGGGRPRPDVAGPGPAGLARPASVNLTGLRDAERQYERATAELMAALGARRASLSPDTAAALDENLRVIDEALAQIRRALESDPASPRLNHMLASTHEKKIDTLRRVLKLAT